MTRIPASLRRAVIDSAQGRCAYCHSPEKLMGVSFEVDHIIPSSAGGKTIADNLCLSCPTCNRHKAARISVPEPLTGGLSPLFNPNRDSWPDHFAWSEDGSVITGVTPTGRATVEALLFNRSPMILLRQYWRATGVRLDE